MLDPSEVAPPAGEGVFIGLDWGNSQHQLCILDPAGRRVHQGRFAHDVAGLGDLDRQLRAHGRVAGIAIERAEGLLVERASAAGTSVVLRFAEEHRATSIPSRRS